MLEEELVPIDTLFTAFSLEEAPVPIDTLFTAFALAAKPMANAPSCLAFAAGPNAVAFEAVVSLWTPKATE